MTENESIRSKTLTKYRELNEHLKDFLKNVLLLEKSSSKTNLDDHHQGIALLSVKNDLLLHYLMNLLAVMSRRSTPNQSLSSNENRQLILRLCEIRTSLEKIRPIEQKLKYQIDKLLKNDLDQHLNYRANIDNFASIDQQDESNDDEDEDEQEEAKPKVYRPPKLVPMELPEEIEDKDKRNKHLEHLQRRAFHSDVLEDFKRKYSDAPEEVYHSDRSRLLQKSRTYKERIAYEEDYLKRLPQTKRERQNYERVLNSNGNDLLEHLNDADVLFDQFGTNSKKKKGKLSRQMKKHLEKSKKKSVKRFKSRK